MAKTKLSEYDSTAANNTDVDGVNLAEGCPPSGINNAIREVMAHLKDFQSGTSGDSLTVGGALTTTGTLTSNGNANFTGEIQVNGSAGTSGQFLTSQGSGADPIWTTLSGFTSGMLMMWTTGTAPTGWLLCNGAAVSRTTYATLFALVGTTFGVGDGTTTFNLPDYRDRMPIGAGTTYSIAGTGGSKDAITVSHTHTLTDAGHSHKTDGTDGSNYHVVKANADSFFDYKSDYSNANDGNYISGSKTGTSTTGITIDSAGSSGTNANLPPYLGIQFIIKS